MQNKTNKQTKQNGGAGEGEKTKKEKFKKEK